MTSVDLTRTSGAGRPPKQPTKVRHSITLSSVGKALADVINKDNGKLNGAEKAARRSKDIGSRHSRFSAMGTATRTSIDVLPVRRDSPDMKTITRHTRSSVRVGFTSSEESSAKVADLSGDILLTRQTSLKPKPNGSALPKYRPRSVEPSYKRSPTPPLGNRRKLSSSPEGRVKQASSSSSSDSPPGTASPRLKRALKPHASAVSEKDEGIRPLKLRLSPERNGPPSAVSRTPATISAGSAILRPPSSASTASPSRSPSTPTRKSVIAALSTPSPRNVPTSPLRSPLQDSPSEQVARRAKTLSSDHIPSPSTPNQVEGDSYDSIDVEFMLGTIVSPTAPTPALPRIRTSHETKQSDPTTPTRPSKNFLPARSNLSYLSPLPSSKDSPPSLRPKPKNPGNDRGSLLSWEQLAAHTSIEDVDVDHMLSEIPAPFRSGAVSPAPSAAFDVPDSPNLSTTALSSPAGYQSISRVLLPDVTPSPAAHRSAQFERSLSLNAGDGAVVTLLRLQLASAENMAKERLEQMQSLEEQLHAAKQARRAEAEELSKQVSDMEAQLRSSLEARGKTDDDRAAYTASLESRLHQVTTSRKQDVEAAVVKTKTQAAKVYDAAFSTARQRLDVSCLGQETANSWATVRCLTEGQLELVRSNRECLSVILSGLDCSLQTLRAQMTH